MRAIGSMQEMLVKDLREAGEIEAFLRSRRWMAHDQVDADAIVDLLFLPAMAQAPDPAPASR